MKVNIALLKLSFSSGKIFYLYDQSRVLAKQQPDEVLFMYAVQVHLQSTIFIGKVHLQEGSDEPTCRHIMPREVLLLSYKLLDGIEDRAKVGGITNIWRFFPYFIQYLSKTAASKY